MRKVIVEMSVSVDGFVAPLEGAPDHRSAPEDPALKQRKLDWLRHTGTHAMGRVTYQQMAEHWPHSSDEYAPPMNDLPKVVFSKTLPGANQGCGEGGKKRTAAGRQQCPDYPFFHAFQSFTVADIMLSAASAWSPMR